RLPYIYSQTDLDRLLNTCSTFYPHPRVAVTMRTIIGLLAVTGIRIGEALRLKIGDLDVDNHLLLVHGRKTALDRYVVLHPTTTKALTTYLSCPERIRTAPSATGPIFVNTRGHGFVTETIEQHFRALTDSLHLDRPGCGGGLDLTERIGRCPHQVSTLQKSVTVPYAWSTRS